MERSWWSITLHYIWSAAQGQWDRSIWIIVFATRPLWHMFWCQQSVCFAGLWLVPSAFSQCWTTSVRLQLSTAMQCEWRDDSTSPNMQSTHTHILLFGSNFYILAMYVHMLNIYEKYRKNLTFSIFSKISSYFPTLPVYWTTKANGIICFCSIFWSKEVTKCAALPRVRLQSNH